MGLIYAVRNFFKMLTLYKSPDLEAIYFYCTLDAFLFHKKHSAMSQQIISICMIDQICNIYITFLLNPNYIYIRHQMQLYCTLDTFPSQSRHNSIAPYKHFYLSRNKYISIEQQMKVYWTRSHLVDPQVYWTRYTPLSHTRYISAAHQIHLHCTLDTVLLHTRYVFIADYVHWHCTLDTFLLRTRYISLHPSFFSMATKYISHSLGISSYSTTDTFVLRISYINKSLN